MGLRDQAKADIRQFTTDKDSGFAIDITIRSRDLTKSAIVSGLHTKHRLGVDTDGNMVESKKAHVSFSEKLLSDQGYPVRNSDGELILVDHRISVADSTGVVKEYVVQSTYPDEMLGYIVCILVDYEDE